MVITTADGRAIQNIKDKYSHRLGLSEATVKTHVSTLIAKLGVHDRVGAVVHALRNRLV